MTQQTLHQSETAHLATRVEKITGPAGAGKSYEVQERVGEWLQADKDNLPEDVLIVSFLRSHVEDVTQDYRNAAQSDQRPIPQYFLTGAGQKGRGATITTFNSICYRLANLGYADTIIEMGRQRYEDIFQDFFREHAPQFRFAHQSKRPIEMATEGGDINDAPDGNRLIDAYNYLRDIDRNLTTDAIRDLPYAIPTDPATAVEVLEAWETFKTDNSYWQHHDYVRAVRDRGRVPDDYEVLVIDEFQDLNPLQYELYEQWRDSEAFDMIFISGDVAQSVFAWRGARPDLLRETAADAHIKKTKSRRCAPTILETACEIIDPLDLPSDLEARPHRDGQYDPDCEGKVAYREALQQEDIATLAVNVADEYIESESDSIMILARANWQVGRIATTLANQNVPYTPLDDGNWGHWYGKAPAVYRLMEQLSTEEAVAPYEVGPILKLGDTDIGDEEIILHARANELHTALNRRIPDPRDSDGNLPAETVLEWFGVDSVSALPQALAYDYNWSKRQAEAVTETFNTETDINPGDIRVGTIHSAKGAEAEAVILLIDYSNAQWDRYFFEDDEDEERRLYYTASTRAKDGLYLLHNWYGKETFPPLRP